MNHSLIKTLLVILFLFCLADMPYVYYQFVRFVALISFVYLAYQSNQQGKQKQMILYAALALLFQPFFKISLGRELWNVVDVLVAIGLVVSIFRQSKES